MRGVVVLAVLLVASCASAPAPGPTLTYTGGEVSLDIAAGTERDEMVLSVDEGSYAERGSFTLSASERDDGFAVDLPVVSGPGTYSSNGALITLTVHGREFPSTEGGACTIHIAEADERGASGTVTCVGLGTVGGKGYDVGASFDLRA